MKTETAKELLDVIIAGIGREEVLNLLNAQEKVAAAEPSREKEMEEFINSICAKLTVKTLPEYPESNFYMEGDTLMLERDKKTSVLWVRHDKIWSVFYDRFSLNYEETRAVTKTLLKKALKFRGITTIQSPFRMTLRLEKALKLRGTKKAEKGKVAGREK